MSAHEPGKSWHGCLFHQFLAWHHHQDTRPGLQLLCRLHVIVNEGKKERCFSYSGRNLEIAILYPALSFDVADDLLGQRLLAC